VLTAPLGLLLEPDRVVAVKVQPSGAGARELHALLRYRGGSMARLLGYARHADTDLLVLDALEESLADLLRW
jgi:hypothetical protein